MNNSRRKAIAALLSDIEAIKGKVEDLFATAETLRDEEQEAFDAMPEGLQQGDRGQAAEAAASNLDEAVSTLEGVLSSLDEAVSSLEAATE